LINGAGISVVSDIDDTIKISEVPAPRLTLIANTFRRPFLAVKGMSARYAAMPSAVFHYVSGSPWQLYRPLSEFLIGKAGFPEGTFHMKTLSGNPGNPEAALKSLRRFVATERTFDHKVQQITLLMDRFRERRFVLIGDSGECDPEIYRQIATGPFGTRVDQIIIRDVVNAGVTAKQRLTGMTIIPGPTVGQTRCKR
jgi:phosphatidate phosphatase APP1